MVTKIVLLMIAVFTAGLLCTPEAYAREYRVFFLNDGSFNGNSPLISFPRAVNRKRPLTGLLKHLFEGPTAEEKALGAWDFTFGCQAEDSPDSARTVPCSFDDVVETVSIHNDIVHLELKAYPNGATSGIWGGIVRPITSTVKQFPHLQGWIFTMDGYEIKGGDGCGNTFCFRFSSIPPSSPRAEAELSPYGINRLK